MFFEKRPISIAEIDDAGDLAEKLVDYCWCLCNAFRIGGVLFINDATCADGAAEFAVVLEDPATPGEGVQIDTVTFGWINDPTEALEVIIHSVKEHAPPAVMHEGTFAGVPAVAVLGLGGSMKKPVRINPHPVGAPCYLCA